MSKFGNLEISVCFIHPKQYTNNDSYFVIGLVEFRCDSTNGTKLAGLIGFELRRGEEYGALGRTSHGHGYCVYLVGSSFRGIEKAAPERKKDEQQTIRRS